MNEGFAIDPPLSFIELADNLADALSIFEGANNYIGVDTTDSSEVINLGNSTTNPDVDISGSGGLRFLGDSFIQSFGASFPITASNLLSLNSLNNNIQLNSNTSGTTVLLQANGTSNQIFMQAANIIADGIFTGKDDIVIEAGNEFKLNNALDNSTAIIKNTGATGVSILDIDNPVHIVSGSPQLRLQTFGDSTHADFTSGSNFLVINVVDNATDLIHIRDDGVNRFEINATGAVTFNGLTYPIADGTNGQAITTNGSGTLSFTTVGGGGTPGGATGDIQYNNAGAFGGFGDWDGTRMTVDGIINSTLATGGVLELERNDTVVLANDVLATVEAHSNGTEVTAPNVGSIEFSAIEDFSDEVTTEFNINVVNDNVSVNTFKSNSFTTHIITNTIRFTGDNIKTIYRDTGATANEGFFGILSESDQPTFSLFSDTNVAGEIFMNVDRTGTTVDSVNFPNGGVNIGGGTYDTSALLQMTSTTQGFLISGMTGTQKDAISTPANGLMVYDTTQSRPNWFDGTSWLGPSMLRLTNRTGGSVAEGECVIMDTANNSSILYPTTGGDEKVIGAVVDGGTNLSEITVSRGGVYFALVRSADTIAAGDYLETDNGTPGLWRKDTSLTNTSAAQCLEASASGSDRLVKCMFGSTLLS